MCGLMIGVGVQLFLVSFEQMEAATHLLLVSNNQFPGRQDIDTDTFKVNNNLPFRNAAWFEQYSSCSWFGCAADSPQ